MKKIIDGKKYDTETADLLASWDNGYYGGDFNRCEEDLYRTKKGVFFIHGEGGPMSSYAESCGNGRSGGEDIRPIDEGEAMQWCEDREIKVEDVEAIFGKIEEA